MALAKLAGKLSKKLTSKQKTAAQARKVKGKEAADLTVPSDTVRREHVLGQREDKGGRKSSYQDTLPSRYKGRKPSKTMALRREFDGLLKSRQRAEVAKGEKSKYWPIIKERQRGRGKGYNIGGTVKRNIGGEISTKKSIIKRKSGGSIGMGAALRGGGAVRKKG